MLKNTLQLPIEMRAWHDAVDCSGMTVDVQVDGSVRTTVALTHQGGRGMPPSWTWYGYLPLTAATGGGDWVITKVTHGENVLQTQVRFHVYRGSELTLDQPARTSGTARTTLSGQLRRYSNTGALVPAANTTASYGVVGGSLSPVVVLPVAGWPGGRWAVCGWPGGGGWWSRANRGGTDTSSRSRHLPRGA